MPIYNSLLKHRTFNSFRFIYLRYGPITINFIFSAGIDCNSCRQNMTSIVDRRVERVENNAILTDNKTSSKPGISMIHAHLFLFILSLCDM